MGRPAGVTFLAILNFLGTALCVVGGVLFFLGLGLAGVGAQQSGGQAGAMAFLLGMGAAAGVVFLVFAVIALFIGIGLWKLRGWARIVTIILACLSLLTGLLGLLGSLLHFQIFALVLNLVFLAFYSWILWYMFRPHVKSAFGVAQPLQ